MIGLHLIALHQLALHQLALHRLTLEDPYLGLQLLGTVAFVIGAAIFATDEILDEVGVAIPDEQEDEVEKFREFLDQISPDDFGKSA